MMAKKRFGQLCIFVLTIVVLLLPLNATARGIKKGGTAVIALPDALETLIPSTTYRLTNIMFTCSIFEGLVDYDMEGKMVPRLARSWKLSPDGLTLRFDLRKGVKWHDGKDFTSADVAFTIKEAVQKYHPLGKQAFGPVSKIETPGPHTVVFKFEKPWSPTLNFLSWNFSGILPKHIYEGPDLLKNPNNWKPVGTGPFMLKEYKRGSHVIMVRNPNYWMKGKPYLDKVIYRIIRDGTTRIAGFEKGEIDFLPPYSMVASEKERLEKKGFVTPVFSSFLGVIRWMPVNLKNKYLKDRRVRYALSHAINRQEIVDKAYFGIGKPMTGPVPSAISWAYADDVMKFEYDPAKANRMLDEAGYKKGSDGIRFSLELIFTPAYKDVERACRIIQQRFREVGVDIKLRPMDDTAGRKLVYGKKQFDLGYYPLACGPDPAVGTARVYLTSMIERTHGTCNAMSYSNPEADRLWVEGGRSTTREAAVEKYKEVQRVIVKDMPAFWILETPYVMGHNPKLLGLPSGPFYGIDHIENIGWKK